MNDGGLIKLLGKTFWDSMSPENKEKMRKLYHKRLANSSKYATFKQRARA